MNKKALAIAIASAVAVPVTAQAVSFKISGHVNRSIRWVDDGQGTTIQHVDNSASRSRVRFVGSEKFGSMSAGVYIEIGFASNRSSLLAGKDASGESADGGDSVGDIRHSALWYGGNWGKVWLGHTSDSYDGVQFVDKSGTGLINNPFQNSVFAIRARTSMGANAGYTVGASLHSLDGGRLDIIRYDSPKFGPVSASVAHGNNDTWAGRIGVASTFAGHSFEAKIGGRTREGRDLETRYGGSASILFSQGTSITVSAGQEDFNTSGTDDSFMWFAKLGHKWGNNAVSVSYQYHECHALQTFNTAGNSIGCDEGDALTLAWMHTIPKIGAEIMAQYNHYEIDDPRTGVSVEDVDAVMVGTRIKFN